MCGLKVHEDHAAYPAVMDAALDACEAYDVQLSIHTDSINESGHLETTRAAIDGRSVHAFHIEGSGGGHIPDLLELVGDENVIPSSTNPTTPHTRSTGKELTDMITPVHQMEADIPEDKAFAEARVRESTMAAEERLHDMGAIPITSSDSMGMGRAAETVRSTWQTAAKMAHLDDAGGHDNERVLRYLAKYTINPAIVQGIDPYVGSLEAGKAADVVLWDPAFFGAKPERVIKGGTVAVAPIGSENGTTTSGQPVRYKLSVGGDNTAPAARSMLFTNEHAVEHGPTVELDTDRELVPVVGTREVTRSDMVRNTATPDVAVDPGSHEVRIDGEPVEEQPLDESPLARRHFLN
jgi:urease subunit alpha